MTQTSNISHIQPQSATIRVPSIYPNPPHSSGISALRNCLSCSNCKQAFNCLDKLPLTLTCGHTICKACTSNLIACPLDSSPTHLDEVDIQKVPVNYAILQLVMDLKGLDESPLPENSSQSSPTTSSYHLAPSEVDPDIAMDRAKEYLDELADYLVIGVQGTGTPVTASHTSPLHTSTPLTSGQQHLLSRPLQRKLSSLSNCSLSDEEGRTKLIRAARSIGERCINELIVIHQNPQMLTSHLWAAVRQRGCQFLGPQMQENTLQLIHFLLRDGEHLPRKSIVLFVVSRLDKFPSASKTNVGHVVQLLYRASCFNVTKRKDASSLLQLKEDYRQYDALRREHDAQIVQIAYEAGLRISPEQWSSLIYGDLHHKSHMQSIIDKLQTAQSFYNSIHELISTLKKSGDPMDLSSLKPSLELIASISTNAGEKSRITWENLLTYLKSVCHIMERFVHFLKVSGKGKNHLSSFLEYSSNSPPQTRTPPQSTPLPKHSHNTNSQWEVTPIGSSPSDPLRKQPSSLTLDTSDRFNSPLPDVATPFTYSSSMPSINSSIRSKSPRYQHRGVIGTFPNYPTTVSYHNNYNNTVPNIGMLGHGPNHKREPLSPYLEYRNSNSEEDSHLFQMSPQPRPESCRLPQPSGYQNTTNTSWNPRFSNRPQNSKLDLLNPPFSLPAKESHNLTDPYIQQQHRSLPDYKLSQSPRTDCFQRMPDLHVSQSSINSTTSSDLDSFPFLSTLSNLPPTTQNLNLSAPRKIIGENQHLLNNYNLSTLLSDISVDSHSSIYSSGYSSIQDSSNDHIATDTVSNSTPNYKPYRQEWIQARSRELADKEVELNVREAYIKKKENEYYMSPHASSDKILQEQFDKELAEELQRGEIPMQGYSAYNSDQDQLDPILSQIITNLHI
ncbi:hypothetical protein LOD99_7534 [Oopsacas minuta]|uniref:RING-type E3 ubiquitin transferase n=1 Tax=Oopsacas minuta TaxID=111878 RepID=A0AAV7JP26_9METZ|nr:hypothetical protein LOD99_7534 [Oopsacas minuta]